MEIKFLNNKYLCKIMPKKHRRINSFYDQESFENHFNIQISRRIENSCKRKIKYLQIGEKNVLAFAVDTIQFTDCIFGSIKLLIESLFINSLIFQVIAVILAACYYLLNKQENVDNQTK